MKRADDEREKSQDEKVGAGKRDEFASLHGGCQQSVRRED